MWNPHRKGAGIHAGSGDTLPPPPFLILFNPFENRDLCDCVSEFKQNVTLSSPVALRNNPVQHQTQS